MKIASKNTDVINMGKVPKIPTLIADHDRRFAASLAQYLETHGFDCQVVTEGKVAKDFISKWKPQFILADLILPDCNAMELLRYIDKSEVIKHENINVLVLSGHAKESNVKQAYQNGACDFLIKPLDPQAILQRLALHLRKARAKTSISNETGPLSAKLALHLTDLVLKQALAGDPLEDILYHLTRMLNHKLGGVRCSIVEYVDHETGHVVASNDDRNACGILLDLKKYPEVVKAVNTGQMVSVDNLKHSPQFRNIVKDVRSIHFNALLVCPVMQNHQPFGALSVRLPESDKQVTEEQIRFVEIVAQVVSLTLNRADFAFSKKSWIKSA